MTEPKTRSEHELKFKKKGARWVRGAIARKLIHGAEATYGQLWLDDIERRRVTRLGYIAWLGLLISIVALVLPYLGSR